MGITTDRVLLDRFVKKGDKAAFDSFFERHYSYFYKRAFSHIKNEEDRKDFLQDFWISILEKVEKVKTDEEGSCIAYLNVAFMNDIYDYYRQKSWATTSLDEEVLGRLYTSGKLQHNNTEEQLTVAEIEQKRLGLLDVLSDTDRSIYNLYEIHRFSIGDIAHFHSLSEGTVRNKISFINSFLKKQLRALYG